MVWQYLQNQPSVLQWVRFWPTVVKQDLLTFRSCSTITNKIRCWVASCHVETGYVMFPLLWPHVWVCADSSSCHVPSKLKWKKPFKQVCSMKLPLGFQIKLHLNVTPAKVLHIVKICTLTIQRGKFCVWVVPTWGHIDAAFRLLAFEYVGVGIEGRTAETRSHLNEQVQLITMLLESGFPFLGSTCFILFSLHNTTPKLHVLHLQRQTSNWNWFHICACNLTGLEMLQDQWNFTNQYCHYLHVIQRIGKFFCWGQWGFNLCELQTVKQFSNT
jgi:hypothetical protein